MREPAEFWVMRIVCRESDLVQRPEIVQAIADGRMNLVNHEVVEPIEVFQDPDEDRAQSRAMEFSVKRHQATGHPHKVVMSADV